jgi:hypothetical protein
MTQVILKGTPIGPSLAHPVQRLQVELVGALVATNFMVGR